MFGLALAVAASALPEASQCQAAALEPEAALAQSIGLQGYIYGYPLVDLLKQRFNETHRVSADQPVVAPVNTIAVYPHLLTPETQGQLRAANSDTLYLNAWIDLSKGPVLLDVPDMGRRYYTLAFMDLYARPWHLGTRTNGGKAARYALVGPTGGAVPEGYTAFRLPTDTAWMLGRVLVTGETDLAEARRLAQAIRMNGAAGEPVSEAAPLQPFDSLAYFDLLNRALRSVPAKPGETALMAQFDVAGFGPGAQFDAGKLSDAQKLGLGCALKVGPQVLGKRGFRPRRVDNGWMWSGAMADPGDDFLLRAEVARGGYVNAPEESIYPAAITDDRGEPLDGKRSYRLRFARGALPPVDAFWSLTAYDRATSQLIANPIRRYAIGDRTGGLKYGKDGSLTLVLSNIRPREGASNWLPVPPGAFHAVMRLYLPRAEALEGRYRLPAIERIGP
ncbi:DUF1254 domain-containing protein [Novosphingobium sp.]|uniref:DUF1254 domain-containing protein n=1 Tax=Novosphingobium sp. TaxID=1874826 RepID=UPI001EC9B4D9|nr:DUF1254 domain-containing protein [Novosphingobium sp.]MBK6802338.1 DUF1254 domain-containing protein [Novosphingobium sp.]MBK9009604.1 DUF1254 domain-containing protein [Novosphingobium sp.]